MVNRRALLLFPILAPIFLLGWIMSVVGERKDSRKSMQNKAKSTSLSTQDVLEFGMMPEITQEVSRRK